jgi:hypothetical protein
MTTLREAAQQALEALESLFNWQVDPDRGQRCSDAITALRDALAQQEQEPVAKMHVVFEDNNGALRRTPAGCQAFGANGQPAAVYVGRQRYVLLPRELIHFYTLVAAAEREACADICDQHASVEGIAQRCAEQIRARNKT